MPGHYNQVETLLRPVVLRRGLNPLNLFRVTFASGHSQHRRCWIDTRHPMTTLGKRTAECACTATQIEHATGMHSGEGDVEVGVLRPGVCELVKLCDLRQLIIQILKAEGATESPSPLNYKHVA